MNYTQDMSVGRRRECLLPWLSAGKQMQCLASAESWSVQTHLCIINIFLNDMIMFYASM